MTCHNLDGSTLTEAEIAVLFLLVLVLHAVQPELLQVPGAGAVLDVVLVETGGVSCCEVFFIVIFTILIDFHIVALGIFNFDDAIVRIVGLNYIERWVLWIL